MSSDNQKTIAEAEADALVVGGIVEAARHKPGNAAAMREALGDVYNTLEKIQSFIPHLSDVSLMRKVSSMVCHAKNVIDTALSAPPRNCDVGTPEQQRARHDEYCLSTMCCTYSCKECFARWGADALRGGRSGGMIAGQCELCTNYVDELYDASTLADAFGMCASFRDDDAYFVCGDCLNNIESMVKSAWQKKEGAAS